MTKRHPDFFEVLVCQIRQNGETNVILGESLSVSPKAERLKPVRNLLHRGPYKVKVTRAPGPAEQFTVDA